LLPRFSFYLSLTPFQKRSPAALFPTVEVAFLQCFSFCQSKKRNSLPLCSSRVVFPPAARIPSRSPLSQKSFFAFPPNPRPPLTSSLNFGVMEDIFHIPPPSRASARSVLPVCFVFIHLLTFLPLFLGVPSASSRPWIIVPSFCSFGERVFFFFPPPLDASHFCTLLRGADSSPM